VESLVVSGGRIAGVNIAGSADGITKLEGDLIVDAAGRGSAGPAWLEAAGFTAPEETIVNGFVGYASRWVRIPEEAWPGDFRFIGQQPLPSQTKGGILYPQDSGLYIMSLFGHARDYPPSDEVEYMAFLKECGTPLMYEVMSKAEPVSEIAMSRSTANRARHYERLTDQPAGFVALGDAIASFNPIFGQGITSATVGAVTLAETIKERGRDLNGLGPVFQPKIAEWLRRPWGTSTGYDLAFPTTVGNRPEPTPESIEMARYLDVLAQLATVDVSVAEAVLVANQTFEPSLLQDPELVAKAKAWVDEGRTPPTPDPSRPPSLSA
jgi:hypothetical protein